MIDRNHEQCRICKTPLPDGMNTPTFPFCSARCKQIDFNRWMTGDYAISEPLPLDEMEEMESPDAFQPSDDSLFLDFDEDKL